MKKTVLMIIYVILSTLSLAQPMPGERPNDGGTGIHEDTNAPITTATLLLLVLGSGYSIYKVRKYKKDK
jgi:hypothetical protein